MNLADELRASARRDPDAPALRLGSHHVTYGTLDGQVDAAVRVLRTRGVLPGDRVALMLGSTPSFVVAIYAAWRLGGVAVPIDTAAAAPEVARRVSGCRATVLVIGRAHMEAAVGLRETSPDLAHVLVADPGRAALPEEMLPEGMASWSALLAAGAAAPEEVTAQQTDGESLAVLAYTPGSTGAPKAAMLTHGQLLANHAQMRATGIALTADDVVFTPLPLFHVYGLNVAMALTVGTGASLALMERYDPAASLSLVSDGGVTVVMGAPTLYVAWLATPGAAGGDLSAVRLAMSSAAALQPRTLRRCREELGLDVREGYGLTEAAPIVTSSVQLDEAVEGSAGMPLQGVEVRILDTDGKPVRAGDPGRLQVRGDNVFSGYWENPKVTAETLTRDGWLDTGDVAYADDRGMLFIVDRASDLIIVSGFTVYPREIEETLAAHPAVAHAAVVGVPHPHTGETVKAVVVPEPETDLTAEELISYCGARLARFKQPTIVEFVDALPLLPTGRIQRSGLRAGS